MISTNEPIRVLHLVSALNVGGLEMVVLDLARRIDRRRFAPAVLCLHEPGTLAPRLAEHDVPVESLGCAEKQKGRLLWRLVARLRELRPHLLHTHNPKPHIYGALAARALGIPVVHTKHGRNWPSRFRSVALNRFASCLTEKIVPVSAAAAKIVCAVEKVPAHKVSVIRNGIELADFPVPAAPRADLEKRAIHVARLNAIKDQPTLLRAARLVADCEPDFRLDLAGAGPMRSHLEALVQVLRLTDQVRFLGYRADVSNLLAQAGLFVLSSVSEGISLTLLEAMAVGLPVVATDVGGNREVVVHGTTGLLVPAQSPEKLAQAMLELLRNPERARRMGQAGRLRVEQEFDLRQVVSQYEALYERVLERNTSKRKPAGQLVETAAG